MNDLTDPDVALIDLRHQYLTDPLLARAVDEMAISVVIALADQLQGRDDVRGLVTKAIVDTGIVHVAVAAIQEVQGEDNGAPFGHYKTVDMVRRVAPSIR